MCLIVNIESTMVLFAVVVALGLVTVFAVEIMLTMQEVNAAKPPTQGCRTSVAVNASQGRCFHG
jgi:hypothetical protein